MPDRVISPPLSIIVPGQDQSNLMVLSTPPYSPPAQAQRHPSPPNLFSFFGGKKRKRECDEYSECECDEYSDYSECECDECECDECAKRPQSVFWRDL